MEFDFLTWLALPLVFFCGFILSEFRAKKKRSKLSKSNLDQQEYLTFLFDGHELIDTNLAAESVIEAFDQSVSPLDNLVISLRDQFSNIESIIDAATVAQSVMEYSPSSPHLSVEISKKGKRMLITVRHDPFVLDESVKELILSDRLSILEEALSASPNLVWKEKADGSLSWCNNRYAELTKGISPGKKKRSQILNADRIFPAIPVGKVANKTRHSLPNKTNSAEHWFNVVSVPVQNGTFHFASDAAMEVKAEMSQKTILRTFVQIFAQLSIGLAIFDKDRQLAIYNPAFCDLTELNPTFLTSKPTLSSLLDQLRNSNMAPEPRSYPIFRGKLLDLETAAKNGTYREIWRLPNNQNIRVTGRPYPDGALAFIFEDVSSELKMADGHRSEIKLYQDALDTVAEPIFTFSASCRLVYRNTAAEKFFGGMSVENQHLSEILAQWRTLFAPSAFWTDLEKFQDRSSVGDTVKDKLTLHDGRNIEIVAKLTNCRQLALRLRFLSSRPQNLPRVLERRKA